MFKKFTFVLISHFRELYDSYEDKTSASNKRKQEFGKKVAHFYIPVLVLVFTFVYWMIGLKNAKLI